MEAGIVRNGIQGRRLRRLALFALVAGAVLLPAAAAPAQDGFGGAPGGSHRAEAGNVIEGSFIVGFRGSVRSPADETDRLEAARGFRARFTYRTAIEGFAARLSRAQVEALRADPDVSFVVPDRTVEALGTVPLSAGESVPPGVRRIGAATPTTTRQASDAGVAVIDTGIDLGHPDLKASNGKNCVTPGTPAQDDEGHGTHVAGTIAAENDGAGVVGVAPGTKLYAVKVLDNTGSGTWSQVICGIDWVTANASALNIKVANMSLGGPGSNDNNCGQTDKDPLHQAVCRSTQAGVLNVVAAGNDGWDLGDSPPDTPAAFPEVLTVTAISDTDGKGGGTGPAPTCRTGEADDSYATFSNYATRPADAAHMIAAPGVCISSTVPGGGYAMSSGTSMASPHIAGAAALCISEGGASGPCAGKSPAQIITHLRGQAEARTTADTSHGYYGDPLRPNKFGDYFGYLARTEQDTTPPETSITAGPAASTRSTGAELAFTASESGARFECKLDTGTWEACASPKAYAGLTEGAHSFSVRAIDLAGNVDQSPATRTWKVDTTPPNTSLSAGPAAQTNDSTPSFALASSEQGSTFECRIDGGAWSPCTSSHTTARLSDGPHTFEARAADAAGNVDATPASATFTVDTQAPAVTISNPTDGQATNDSSPALGGAAGWAAGDAANVTVKIYAGTTASGTPVQTHSQARSERTWAIEAAALGDGQYTAKAEQVDGAGNSGTSAAVRFVVDTVAPDSSLVSGPSGLTNDSTPTFDIASTETTSTFECRVDANPWAPCNSPHTTSTLPDGDHSFEVRAADRAGNVDGTPARRSLTVDTVAPDASITSGPSGLTKSSTPTFEFAASEAGADFECRVDTASWAACSSPHRTEPLAAGSHTFEVRAGDRAGNRDATPAARSFEVDPEAVSQLPPSASSGAASAVEETSARVSGVVNPNGRETTYFFEYGTTSAYGARTPEASAGNGTTDSQVTALLSGLSPGTRYHYRLVATNANGTTRGADHTLTTKAHTATAPTADSNQTSSSVESAPAAPAPAPAEDRTAPESRVVLRRQRLEDVVRRGVRAVVSCSEACSMDGRLTSGNRVLGRGQATLAEAGEKAISIKLTRKAKRRIADSPSIRLELRLTVADPAGNRETEIRRVRVRH